MTEYELHSLVYELFRDMDSMIEFWITATFAVVIAVFAAKEYLSPAITKVILVIYLASSVMFALRWVLFLSRVIEYRDILMREYGSDIPTNWPLVGTITVLMLLVFLAGVATASYFLVTRSNSLPVSQSDPQKS